MFYHMFFFGILLCQLYVNGDELSNRVTCIHSQLFIHFELPFFAPPAVLEPKETQQLPAIVLRWAERLAKQTKQMRRPKTKDIRPLRSNQTCLIDQDSSYCAYSMWHYQHQHDTSNVQSSLTMFNLIISTRQCSNMSNHLFTMTQI